MAMKTDFHDHLISVLDHHQLFMAIKNVFFMSHEITGFNEALKIGNAKFMALKKDSWAFHKYFMGFL